MAKKLKACRSLRLNSHMHPIPTKPRTKLLQTKRDRVDKKSGHVIILDLHPIPDPGGWSPIGGEISPSLLELKHLNHLDLSMTAFKEIPQFIGSLNNLTYLNLSNGDIGGTDFHQLGSLLNLRSLDLGSNFYFTPDTLEWLARLSSLENLNMPVLNLTEAVYWLESIITIPPLISLDLSQCQFPEFTPPPRINCSKSLEVLYFNQKKFNHSVFPWLFNISSNLTDLYLSSNYLKGPIPESMADMYFLTRLDLSNNELEGGIPNIFGINLCNLQTLDLSQNILTGQLPNFLENLTGCTRNSLEILRLSMNQISGSLPDLSEFSSLRELHLDNNQLKGPLPNSIAHLSRLTILNLEGNHLSGTFSDLSSSLFLRELRLSKNQLYGTILENVGQLSSLTVFDVSSNNFSGTISPSSHLSNLSKLQYLDLSCNSFTFNFCSGWLPPFQLHTIKLSSCQLGPHFPNWLQTQKSFSHLDISNSGISETIPNWFWNLPSKLEYLDLSLNCISGEVPNLTLKFDNFLQVDLSSNLFYSPIPLFLANATVLNLSKNVFSGSVSFLCSKLDRPALNYLDLSYNILQGELPDCWMNWYMLVILNLASNNFSGKIPPSLGSLQSLQTLHLSNNSFSGTIPSTMRNCSSIKLLDLGENRLSENVPWWIGEDLRSLIILRLGSNNFYGSIPSTLCHLSSIQILDLSRNNISGTIPFCLKNLTAMAQNKSLGDEISIEPTNNYNYWYDCRCFVS
ncbi:hypothetical protein RJ640_025395 [Escallonia rubra]|uniref:Disease resistance R13L4/SHOC-2-like LRR domain-containing protein n=1 Tax=Escallonia rubra TaxID=112253 RepID=A0AA88S3X8_9ASTE|nr:hypothetical protein RJ640_025395 [Escallonia rubra]